MVDAGQHGGGDSLSAGAPWWPVGGSAGHGAMGYSFGAGTSVTPEQLSYRDRHRCNRFGPSPLGAGPAAMFPELTSVEVTASTDSARDAQGARCRWPVDGQSNAQLTNPAGRCRSALDDIAAHAGAAETIEGAARIET